MLDVVERCVEDIFGFINFFGSNSSSLRNIFSFVFSCGSELTSESDLYLKSKQPKHINFLCLVSVVKTIKI